MSKIIIRRLCYTILVLLGVSIITFILVRLAPGNPARLMLPDGASEAQVAEMEIAMGLDKPLYYQYFHYLSDIIQGDLGTSIFYKKPCAELIFGRLPATAQLTGAALLFSLVVALPLGLVAGIKKGSTVDFISMFFALLGQSMSQVWLGLLLILIFGVTLGWLPTQGMGGISYLILPAITAGMQLSALVTRMLRSGMIDVLQEDYITAARARGISKMKIYTKYALKNAILPVVTVVGSQIGVMLAGSIVTEQIFGWPGLGSLTVQAIGLRDFPLVQSILLVIAFIFVMVNLLVDILYTFIDPRIKIN